jgi:hypothetical protein
MGETDDNDSMGETDDDSTDDSDSTGETDESLVESSEESKRFDGRAK